MKNRIALVCIILLGTIGISEAQLTLGAKAGLNFNSFGDLKDAGESLSSDGKAGFHVGVWARAKVPLLGMFVRPEFVYTSIKSEYSQTVNSEGINSTLTSDYDLQKIDVPILLGTKILGIGSVFIGPSFQMVVGSDFKSDALSNINDVDTDSFSLGIQLGAGVEFGKLGIDVRWERGLSDLETKIIHSGTEEFTIDSRPNQVILGLSYKFN